MLVSFIVANREEIIARTRAQIAKRLAPRATEGELTTGIPLFLDQLVETLRHVPAAMIGAMEAGAAMHGAALLGRGYTVAQVVHDYGDVCQAITQLAHETGAAITADEFQTLNLSLDRVIAAAVAEYSRLRDLSASAGETERLGVFSHELRNQLTSAVLAFHAIRSGKAPIGGSVASVLARSLQSMTSIISQTLVEVRLDSGMTRHQRTNVRNLVEEAEVGGTLEAGVHGVSLSVEPVDPAIAVNADPQILAGALANLLQNAFKFTHAGGHVSVRAAAVGAGSDRGRGRVRRTAARQARRALRRLYAAWPGSNGPRSRALHQPQGNRCLRGGASRARHRRKGMCLHDRSPGADDRFVNVRPLVEYGTCSERPVPLGSPRE